jgi:hypothetical protein
MEYQQIDTHLGEVEQKTAAAIVGGYGFFIGFFVGEFLCKYLAGGG